MELYPEFDCATCTKRMKVDRGCENDAPIQYWTDLNGVKRSRCPRRPILDNPVFFNAVFQAYNHYQNGFLPCTGGLYDQHARYPTLMQIVEATTNKCDEIRRKREQSKIKNANNNGGKKGISLLGKR